MRHVSMNQQGFTLIEFMIAGVIGLLLVAGVIQQFISVSTTSRLNLALNRVQENGQLALNVLEKSIQRAGWTDQEELPESFYTLDNNILFVGQSDANGNAIAVGSANNQATDIAGNNLTIARPSDRLTVQYHGFFDCLGNEVNGGDIGVVVNHYYLSDNDGIPELHCKGNASSEGQVLVSNIESLQFLYGVDVLSNGKSIQYFNADELDQDGAPSEAKNRIAAIKVGLVVRSDLQALGQEQEQYAVLDEQTNGQYADRRLRRIFTKTVYVPNKTY